jgi:hypothetical protein
MYGFVETFPTQGLLGSSLDSVCVSINTIGLHFTNWTVIANGTVRFRQKDLFFEETPPVAATYLPRLIGESVGEARIVSSAELRLVLSGGWTISLIDDIPHYEAFAFHIGPETVYI